MNNPIHAKSKERFNLLSAQFNKDYPIFQSRMSAILTKENQINRANSTIVQIGCSLPFSTQIPKLNITFVDNRKKCECCNSSLAEFKIKDKNQAILEEEVLYLMEVMEDYFITNKVSSSERERIQKCMNDHLVKKYGAFTAMSGTIGNFERFLGAGLFTARMSVDRKIPLYQVSDFCSKRCENDPRCKD